mmetsp:Transcript_22889/g.42537  ORF Transcript_22889/g.42537 Transcript_22889/m.42537 type:complete len:86 (+) Transcript_22889:62-319(+)
MHEMCSVARSAPQYLNKRRIVSFPHSAGTASRKETGSTIWMEGASRAQNSITTELAIKHINTHRPSSTKYLWNSTGQTFAQAMFK